MQASTSQPRLEQNHGSSRSPLFVRLRGHRVAAPFSPPHVAQRSGVEAHARRPREQSDFSFEKENQSFRVSYKESTVLVPESSLLLAGLTLLGLGVFVGPLVIGLAVTAASIGAAVAIGAVAMSTMFLPIAFFLLTFGGFFGGFALLGLGLFVPKLASLVVTGGALALGWAGVRMLLPQSIGRPAVKNAVSEEVPASRMVIDVDPEVEEAKRVSQELRDFDAMLADREHNKRMGRYTRKN